MKKSFNKCKNQDGLVLVVVLIMVPVIFMLSYTSINKLTVGERATTNVVDRGHAFYAAEMSVADAEAWMLSGKEPFINEFSEDNFKSNKGFFGIGADVNINDLMANVNTPNVVEYGYYQEEIADPPVQPTMEIAEVNLEPPVATPVNILGTLDKKPVYIIQLIDMSVCVLGATHSRALFKVTARGWGVQESTMVTLETFFSLKFLCEDNPHGQNL